MITIMPLKGIQYNEKFIPLGCSKEEIESTFGKTTMIRNSYYYLNSELRFDFDQNGILEFIEFLGGIDGNLKPMIYDRSAFETNADDLVEILKEYNNGEVEDNENGHALVFQNISVGVYREIVPSDVLEMIEEMRADGISTENNEDLEVDKRRANHWATIGIGGKGYYKK